jgi:ABC-type amino acid transport substrate-binding protein
LAFVFVTIATSASAQALPTPAAEIAPTGSLRVGFQIGSPILAKRAQDGSVTGVVVDLGKHIAAKLGVKFDVSCKAPSTERVSRPSTLRPIDRSGVAPRV